MAAQLGLEPRQNESESFVLPLHHWAKFCSARARRPKMEPAMGFEPATACLQNRCSTIELRRRNEALRLQFGLEKNTRNVGWWLPGDSNPEPTD